MSIVPMTPDQLVRQLEKWEVPFRKLPSFTNPNSGRDDETGLKFGPVYGCVTHHTGSDGTDEINRELILEGRNDLPGPLAQFGGNDNGVIDLITCGRANHAGGGDGRVLEAVKNESYLKYPPRTQKHQGSPGAVDGNDAFYGLEVYYSGGHQMTEAMYDSMILLWAAICDFHGWTAKSVIGHKEWSDWKPDPGNHDMHQIRLDVQNALDEGPPSKRKPAPTNVTKARRLLQDAIELLDAAPEDRFRVHDIKERIQIQRARLPKR